MSHWRRWCVCPGCGCCLARAAAVLRTGPVVRRALWGSAGRYLVLGECGSSRWRRRMVWVVCGRGGRRGGFRGGGRTRGAGEGLLAGLRDDSFSSVEHVWAGVLLDSVLWTYPRFVFGVLLLSCWYACHGRLLLRCAAGFPLRCCAPVLACTAGCFGAGVVHDSGGALARRCHSCVAVGVGLGSQMYS